MSIEHSVRVIVDDCWDDPSGRFYMNAENSAFIFWQEAGIFRQMFRKLDLANVIELACGHGRQSERAASLCRNLTLMDVVPYNIEKCKDKLMGQNVLFYVNNGYDFRPVADDSMTAIFCYDSMVHFSADLIASYLRDAARVLMPAGRALFHHSNYTGPAASHYGQNPHSRNTMSQLQFQQLALSAGLCVIQSEIMAWGNPPHGVVQNLDCLTLVQKP